MKKYYSPGGGWIELNPGNGLVEGRYCPAGKHPHHTHGEFDVKDVVAYNDPTYGSVQWRRMKCNSCEVEWLSNPTPQTSTPPDKFIEINGWMYRVESDTPPPTDKEIETTKRKLEELLTALENK